MLKIKPFDSYAVVFVVKNRLLMNPWCSQFSTKTATLCCRRPTVSISPIVFNMFVYLSVVLLPFVNLPNIGSTLFLNVTQLNILLAISLLQTEGGLIRVSQSFVTVPGYHINLNYGQEPISSDLNH